MTLPKNRQSFIKIPRLSSLTICFLIGLISVLSYITVKLYSSTQLLPIGSELRQIEEEVEKITDSSATVLNDLAHYNSTELIRIQAETELEMKTPETVIYLPVGNLAQVK
ncbi:hypothetical protein JW962_01280 [Candidatus Dojkabacteria bacterium]|nr:hypothetical protein [Candidatus Dojkabacteria bacterium]